MNRVRKYWLLAAAVLGVILIDVWQHAHVVTLGYEIDRLESDRDRERRLNRELTIEYSALMSLERIEGIAKSQLGMIIPSEGQAILVQAPAGHRVIQPEPESPMMIVKR